MYAEEQRKEEVAYRKELENVKPTVSSVRFEQHYLTGRPGTEIVDFAVDNNIDLIVMASHGRSGISRLLLGSIAEEVMRKAPCPVLVVKQPVAPSDKSEKESVFQTAKGDYIVPT
jgi:nucleotide-binding universal stress UspA family protein